MTTFCLRSLKKNMPYVVMIEGRKIKIYKGNKPAPTRFNLVQMNVFKKKIEAHGANMSLDAQGLEVLHVFIYEDNFKETISYYV